MSKQQTSEMKNELLGYRQKELHEVRKKRLKGGLGKGHLSLVPRPIEGQSSPVTPEPHLTEAVPSETEVAQILTVWRTLGLYLDRNTVPTHLAELSRWQDQWTKRGISS